VTCERLAYSDSAPKEDGQLAMTNQKRDIVIPGFVREIIEEYDSKETAFPEWEPGGALSDSRRNRQDMPQEGRKSWWPANVAFRFNPCGRKGTTDG